MPENQEALSPASIGSRSMPVSTPYTCEPLISAEEAALLLGGLRAKTIQLKARRGELPSYRVGRSRYFRASDLDSWIRSRSSSRSVRQLHLA